jgi:cytoskeleton protein RodZ
METFGSYLKAHREKKGIRLEEIASITKIHLHSLELLESGSWTRLPPEPFIRGFIIAYAKYVGLDPKDVVNRYVEEVHPHLAPIGTPPASITSPNDPSTPITKPVPKAETTKPVVNTPAAPVEVAATPVKTEKPPKEKHSKKDHLKVAKEAKKPEAVTTSTEVPPTLPAPLIKMSPRAMAIATAAGMVAIVGSGSLYLFLNSTPSPTTKEAATEPANTPAATIVAAAEPAPQTPPSPAAPVAPANNPAPVVEHAPTVAISPMAPPTAPGTTSVNSSSEMRSLASPNDKNLETTPAPVVPKEEIAHEVVVEGRDRTWIKVVIDDKAPVEFFLPEGDKVTYKAKTKIKVVLGNSTGSKVTHNGEDSPGVKFQGTIRSYIFPSDARFPQDAPKRTAPAASPKESSAEPSEEG